MKIENYIKTELSARHTQAFHIHNSPAQDLNTQLPTFNVTQILYALVPCSSELKRSIIYLSLPTMFHTQLNSTQALKLKLNSYFQNTAQFKLSLNTLAQLQLMLHLCSIQVLNILKISVIYTKLNSTSVALNSSFHYLIELNFNSVKRPSGRPKKCHNQIFKSGFQCMHGKLNLHIQ